VASSVAFTGTEQVGETLTRTYNYSDADGDAEGVSTTQWYRADDGSGTNEAAISGATSSTYTLVSADEGKFIRVGVTPVAATGTSPGTEAFSSYTGAIAAPASTDFTFTVETTTTDEDFQLGLVPAGSYSIDVDWGDGNSDTITAYDDAAATHTYATAGEYTVTISGTMTLWSYQPLGFPASRNLITAVTNWGDVGITTLDDAFYSCFGLASVAAGCWETSGANYSEAFRDCPLASIPTGFITSAPNVTNGSQLFFGTDLTALPSDLFDNLAALQAGNSMFQNCTSLMTIPAGVFDSLTALADISIMFAGCTSLTALPDNLFANSPLTTAVGVFINLSSLTDLDFGGWNWSNVTNASLFLSGATINTTDYNNSWIGIDAQSLQSSVAFHGGNSVATGAGLTARNNVISTYGWTVTDAS